MLQNSILLAAVNPDSQFSLIRAMSRNWWRSQKQILINSIQLNLSAV